VPAITEAITFNYIYISQLTMLT